MKDKQLKNQASSLLLKVHKIRQIRPSYQSFKGSNRTHVIICDIALESLVFPRLWCNDFQMWLSWSLFTWSFFLATIAMLITFVWPSRPILVVCLAIWPSRSATGPARIANLWQNLWIWLDCNLRLRDHILMTFMSYLPMTCFWHCLHGSPSSLAHGGIWLRLSAFAFEDPLLCAKVNS